MNRKENIFDNLSQKTNIQESKHYEIDTRLIKKNKNIQTNSLTTSNPKKYLSDNIKEIHKTKLKKLNQKIPISTITIHSIKTNNIKPIRYFQKNKLKRNEKILTSNSYIIKKNNNIQEIDPRIYQKNKYIDHKISGKTYFKNKNENIFYDERFYQKINQFLIQKKIININRNNTIFQKKNKF